ncbi:DUF2975 domain-containing protein [Arsenicibacter rosenii]|uniref:DUF2975 domain-containing protein n=1 Tax=Arsenicibacter rosenii TaxID=1750698 RepID=A0A1S2VDU8_9BACT|nr:DUF2975 domain-containing protein [Arsenicibacter rosenii]OIN56937.1 hypothetical protein BLX24_22500 [Arsenicibacter rosenii]
MKSTPLIRWIYRIFDTLFFGQITIYCLALCLPLIVGVAHWYEARTGGNAGHKTTRSGGLRTALTFPVAGHLSRPHTLPDHPRKDTLSVNPPVDIKLAENNVAPYLLTFTIGSWQDFRTIPAALIILGYLRLLLYIGSLLWANYLLRNMFRALTYEIYFSHPIWKRCQTVGWIITGYFFAYNLIMNLSHAAAWRYLAAKGFHEDWQQPFLWPDNWMWLWAGLTLLVFAQAFRFGTQLQQEKDLTI